MQPPGPPWRNQLRATPTQEHVASKRNVHTVQLESGMPQQGAPFGSREETVRMAVMRHSHLTAPVSNQDREVDHIFRVGGSGIGNPLQEAKAASVGVVAALIRVLDEGLAYVVRDEQRYSARSQMRVGGFHHRQQVSFVGHMTDGVLHKYGIECLWQADNAYVRLDVLAVRVELSAHRKHLRGLIDEGHGETLLEVEGEVARSGPELQHVARLTVACPDQRPRQQGRFCPALLRSREGRIPIGQLAVELH